MSNVVETMRSMSRRLAVRLVAAMLLVALPLAVAEGLVLTSRASASLTDAAESRGESVARAVTLRLEDWVTERQAAMVALGAGIAGVESGPGVSQALQGVVAAYPEDYKVIELVNVNGTTLASSNSKLTIDPSGTGWFQTALSGEPALTSITRVGNHLQWIVAQPVFDADGVVE